jgi:hypothetical protein
MQYDVFFEVKLLKCIFRKIKNKKCTPKQHRFEEKKNSGLGGHPQTLGLGVADKPPHSHPLNHSFFN